MEVGADVDVDVDVEAEEEVEVEVEVEVVELLGPLLPQAVRSPAAVTTTAATRAARPKRATRRVGPDADRCTAPALARFMWEL